MGASPVAAVMVAWVWSIWNGYRDTGRVERLAWSQVWFCTGYPASWTMREICGVAATSYPTSKKVAGT